MRCPPPPTPPAPHWSYARIELSDIFHLVFMVFIYLILHTWFAFVSFAATLTIEVTHIQKPPLQRNDNVSWILTSCGLFWLHPKQGSYCRGQCGERGADGSTDLSRYRAQLFRFEGHWCTIGSNVRLNHIQTPYDVVSISISESDSVQVQSQITWALGIVAFNWLFV